MIFFFFQPEGFDIFLILHDNIRCGYSSEVPHRGAAGEYPQHMFSWRNKNIYHTFTRKYVHFAYVILTWLSSTYHSCGERCDNGSRGWYGFLQGQKKPISLGHEWYGFFARAKNPYHYIRSTRGSSLWLCIEYQTGKLVRKKNVW